MGRTTRRSVLTGCALAGMTRLVARPAAAQLPRSPIRLLVGTAPGSGSDLATRILAQKMGDVLGLPVVVDNRTGGGGIVAVQAAAQAPKDGSVLVVGTATTLIIHPILNRSVTFNTERDFAGVSGLIETPFVVLAGERQAAPRDMTDLLAALAKSDANYGSLGVGTFQHLIGESLLQKTRRKATHVPYRGSSPLITSLVRGDLLFGVDSIAGSRSAMQSKQVRVLAVTSEKRVPSMPDVPTLSEVLGDALVVTGWAGVFAPAGSPPATLDALQAAALKALADSETVSRLAPLALDPLPLTGAALMARVRAERPFWAEIIRAANVRIED